MLNFRRLYLALPLCADGRPTNAVTIYDLDL